MIPFVHGKCPLNTCQFYRMGCDIMTDTSDCKKLQEYLRVKKEVKRRSKENVIKTI